MLDFADRLDFIRKILGDYSSAKDGNTYFKCFNCGTSPEKKKLVLKLDTELWHCWSCEIKGRSIFSLLRKVSPPHAQEWSKRFSNKGRTKFEDDQKPAEILELPACYPVDELARSRDPDAAAIVSYLEDRNVSLNTAIRYRLMGGLTGRVRRRVVFPSYDADGDLNYWTARAIDKNAMRYVNPAIDRKSIVFNEVDIDWSREVVLVEGPFDLLSAGDNCVPLLGSSMPRDCALLKRLCENNSPVLLALDSDAITKSHTIAKLLYGLGLEVRMINLKGAKDIDEIGKEKFLQIAKDAAHWQPESRLSHLISNIASGSLV